MRLTARQLNRATLGRQLLLAREPLSVVDAVDRIVAVQAQEPASPYLALWNRIREFDARDLDRAYASHRVIKATLMRVTMHAVTAQDYPAFHEAMQVTLRAARLNDRRFTSEQVSLAEIDALLPDLLAFTATPRQNGEVEAWLTQRFGEPKPRVWWALRQQGPFVHAPTGGAWSFAARPSYIGAPAQERLGDEDQSRQTLVRRYLEGFGPATLPDIASFALLQRSVIRAALDGLGDALVRYEAADGATLYDVPDGLLPPEDAPAPPRLLGMWDSALLAYADRSRLTPAGYRGRIARTNGDLLPTVLVHGDVAGVWRPTTGGIEVTAFHALPEATWADLEIEAGALRSFLADREPVIYGRYGRWWSELAGADIRILGAPTGANS